MEIFTDSCADLSPELIRRFNIHIVPLGVIIGENTYNDGVDITAPELFEKVKMQGKLPTTSAPSQAAFIEAFKPYDSLIYIGISSKLSASNQNAQIAAKNLPDKDIRIIDSLNLSTGIGLLVLKAAELRDAGKSIDEIEKNILALVPKVNTSFVIDTLDYLYMGGRCTSMEHLMGSLLKIRPVIEVRHDGTMNVKEKISGSRKKALDSMLIDFKSKIPNIDTDRVFITHPNSDEDALYLKEELLKLASINEICITHAGATISSHCGPACIGILFMTK
jgi:DegV family protein with EDD domain